MSSKKYLNTHVAEVDIPNITVLALSSLGDRWDAGSVLSNTIARYSAYKLFPIRNMVKLRSEHIDPQQEPQTNFQYVGLKNVESNTRRLIGVEQKYGKDIKSKCKLFRRGDILYGRLRPNLNKCFIVDSDFQNGICSSEFLVLIPNKEMILVEFLAELLISRFFKENAHRLCVGSTLPRLRSEDFLGVMLPVPSIEQQKLIIERIGGLRSTQLYHRKMYDELSERVPNELMGMLFQDSM